MITYGKLSGVPLNILSSVYNMLLEIKICQKLVSVAEQD